jgi:hypothetical protein
MLRFERLRCKLLPTSHFRRVESKQIKWCNPVRNERCWIEYVLTLLSPAISENSCHRLVGRIESEERDVCTSGDNYRVKLK